MTGFCIWQPLKLTSRGKTIAQRAESIQDHVEPRHQSHWFERNCLETRYSELLKSTNLTELCQISLGRRWIRKSNKLTKSKVNPNGTPMYDKLCFGKFCCVKDEETPCGRNSQNIFKVVLNTIKNAHVILGRQ